MTSVPHPDHDRALKLIGDLLADARRDLAAWAQRGPNYVPAGRAALVEIEAVIDTLTRMRGELVPALLLDEPAQRARLADLPDPAGHHRGRERARLVS